jgi:trans-aconitate methyltransferase
MCALALLSSLVSSACRPLGADLIYSNAALHWLWPAGGEAGRGGGHALLFTSLLAQLRRPHGILAVGMPNNFAAASHVCMLRALREGAFLAPEAIDTLWAAQPNVHADGAEYYAQLLLQQGCHHVDVWTTEYQQLLSGDLDAAYHPVAEWTKSTAQAPILAALPSDAERVRFQVAYSALLDVAYPYIVETAPSSAAAKASADEGTKPQRRVLFPLQRHFMIAMV